jgi:FkbM family methyltransferase
MRELNQQLFDKIDALTTRKIIDVNMDLVIDIGAYDGEFAATLRDSGIYPNTQFLCIEANPMMQPYIADRKLPYVIAIVGDKNNENVSFYKSVSESALYHTGDSVFREDTPYYDDYIIENRTSYTLDYIVDTLVNASSLTVGLIKIDVQGAELKVIRGARGIIERSPNIVIITEVSLVPYNGIEAPTFFDIHYEMESMGFVMVDIVGYLSANMAVSDKISADAGIQFDAAWARRDNVVMRNGPWPEKSYGPIRPKKSNLGDVIDADL